MNWRRWSIACTTTKFPANPPVSPRKLLAIAATISQSSDLININHDSCILCERCMRACDEVKQNFVICRSGKGYTAHIAFDLNNPMGESSCVSCGECMISCPTDALTFKPNRVVMSDWWKEKVDHGGGQEVDAQALRTLHPLFSYIPYKFLQWNASAAVKCHVQAGQVLCRQGDHGATAFILLGDCKFAILDEARRDIAPTTPQQGVVGDILGRFFGGAKPCRRRTAAPIGRPKTFIVARRRKIGKRISKRWPRRLMEAKSIASCNRWANWWRSAAARI